MKKTKLTRSLLAACSIVALTAVMYGCVHDGGSDTATDGTDMEMGPTPEEQIAALQMQINELRAELGLPAIDIAQLTGSVSDLQGQVSDLQDDIKERDEKIADAAAKAMTAKGKAIFGVLNDMGDIATSAAGDSVIASTAPVVSAKYGGTTSVTESNRATFVGGLSAGLDGVEATDPAFTSAPVAAMLDANNGFSGTMLTWSDATRADTMTVYTDIAASSGQPFSEVHGDADGNGTLDGGHVLNLTATGAGGPTHAGVKGAAFDGRKGGTVTHEPNAGLTPGADPTIVKLPGTYSGAPGSYQCTGDDCTTSVNANGSITFGGTNPWTFTANTGAMVSVADPRYLQFGWWMRDDKTSADILDNVAVFSGTQGGTAAASVDALTGTATYEGGAAGKYAWRDRVADTAHGGHFTAKASLTANFDVGDGTNNSTMSGSISDFRLGDDGTDPNWTVTLSTSGVTDGGVVARAATVMTQWAVGESKADMAGGWQAQLYANTGGERNDNLPTGVSGAFNAEFGEMGRMLGAFGANITNANPPN